jgi:hypothetical protein
MSSRHFLFQSILQIIEKRLKSSLTNIRKNIDRTLDRTPIISTIKRLLERTTPIQVNFVVDTFIVFGGCPNKVEKTANKTAPTLLTQL